MRHLVRISNQSQNRRVNRRRIKEAALHTLRNFAESETLIDITFVGNKKIRALNKKYMGRDSDTDVLSFLLEESKSAKRKIIGDIYISADKARSNASRFNTSYEKELVLYTIHGILHLLGFNDKTRKEKEEIRKIEEKMLNETAKTY